MVVGYIRAHPGGRRVRSDSFGSFGRTRRVVVFIRVRLLRSGTLWGSSGSFGFVRLVWARPGVVGFIRIVIRARHKRRAIDSGSLESFGHALGVVVFIHGRAGGTEFIRVRCVRSSALWGLSDSLGSFRRAKGVAEFVRVCWVHLVVSCGSSESLGFVAYIRALPMCRRAHRVRYVHSDAPCGS